MTRQDETFGAGAGRGTAGVWHMGTVGTTLGAIGLIAGTGLAAANLVRISNDEEQSMPEKIGYAVGGGAAVVGGIAFAAHRGASVVQAALGGATAGALAGGLVVGPTGYFVGGLFD